MDFNKLKIEIKNIPPQETRTDSNDYLEVVINSERLADISGILNRYFGLPAWPSGNEIRKEVKETIEKFGGIMKGQTLYAIYDDKGQTFAMIWPWQSAQYFTLKIGFK